jgi:F-type H+-transporting ATPase subunit c
MFTGVTAAHFAAGLAISLGMLGPGIGLGNAVGKSVEAIGRNPDAQPRIQGTMLVGLAFIEFLGLLVFVVAYLLQAKQGA